VEIGDGERRRLERNLHDGAQQRLIALSVALQPTTEGGIANGRARVEILTALGELRSLAHGIHPASLTDAGLDAAVRELAESSRVPLQIESVPRERFSTAVESAAYRVVLDAVRCAERVGDGRSVSVSIERTPEALRVRLGLPGVDVEVAAHELEHAIDRVNALDGTASLALEEDSTVIFTRVPCGS
jgi:signal transduction histidine kinase